MLYNSVIINPYQQGVSMPAKTKITRDQIIEEAFEMVREGGWQTLTTRAIADRLHISTMPIYVHFKSMNLLEEEIVKKALESLLEYQLENHTGDILLDPGLGYVRFAQEEPHLFKGITDNKHAELFRKHGRKDFQFMLKRFSNTPKFSDVPPAQMRTLLFMLWIFLHGLACLTSSIPLENFENIRMDTTDIIKQLSKLFDTDVLKKITQVDRR